MKKIIFGLLLIFGLTNTASAAGVKIEALVNGDIISSEDITDQINIFMLNSPIPYNDETKEMIRRRVLAQTLERLIKTQAADKENITVSNEEIENQVKVWAKKNNINLSTLKDKGISRQAINDNIKSELAWIKLIRKKYYQSSDITQKEIDETIADVTKDMGIKKYQVLEIFIKKENAVSSVPFAIYQSVMVGCAPSAFSSHFSSRLRISALIWA